MSHVQPPDLLTTSEALEVIGIQSPSTISRWVDSGRITPARKLTGKTGAYLFTRAEAERVRDEFAASRSEGVGA